MTTELEPASLSPEERQSARDLWSKLMPAGSQAQLEAARDALRAAPTAVREAVISAIVELWSRGVDAHWGDNPFD